MIRQLATFPNAMIQRRVDRREMKLELAIVIVSGLLGGVGFGYITMQVDQALAVDNTQLLYDLAGKALTPLLVLLVTWVGYTITTHVLAPLFGGRGPISRLFRTSGWAMVPIGIWYVLRSLVTLVLFAGVDFPRDPEGMRVSEKVNSILELGYGSASDPNWLWVITLLVGVLFVAWSWSYLAVAVAEAKAVDEDDAKKVAAVPAVLYGSYVFWIAIQAAGFA